MFFRIFTQCCKRNIYTLRECVTISAADLGIHILHISTEVSCMSLVGSVDASLVMNGPFSLMSIVGKATLECSITFNIGFVVSVKD